MRRSVYEMDQEMREKKIREGERKIKEGQDRLKEKEQLIQEREQKLHENQQTIIKTSILAMRELNIDETTIKKEIKEKFDLSANEIKDYFAE